MNFGDISNGFDNEVEILHHFNTKEKCIEHLESVIWKNGPVSPFSPKSKVYKCKSGRYKCKDTGKYFSVLNGSFLEGTKVPLPKWFLAIYKFISMGRGLSSYLLAKDIGVTQDTAWFMLSRLRHATAHESYQEKMSEFRIIELDETFSGGKNGNRHWDKKYENCQGRSCIDKAPVLGMLERGEYQIIERPNKNFPDRIVKEKVIIRQSRVICKVMRMTAAEDIQPHIHMYIEHGARIMTDEWLGYNGLGQYYNHSRIYHRKKEFANGETCTNAIEGFWAIAKRAIMGSYYKISRKHLQLYFDEFSFRYNFRQLKNNERIGVFLSHSNRRLKYKDLLNRQAA